MLLNGNYSIIFYVFMNVTSQSLLFLDFCDALSRIQAWLILDKQLDHCSLKPGCSSNLGRVCAVPP